MAYDYDIEKDKPPDTGESPSLGAQRIRHFKEAAIERLKNWVYGFLSDDEVDEGLKKAPLKSQDTAPTQEATKIILYSKTISGIPELFARDKNGVEIQITTNGKINGAGLALQSVDTSIIKDANVTAIKLASDSVETAKIKNANVTLAKLAADALAGRIDYGQYTGNGTNQDITVAFDPTFLIILDKISGAVSVWLTLKNFGFIWCIGGSNNFIFSSGTGIVLGTNKFTVSYSNNGPNASGAVYGWVAFQATD